MPPEATIKMRIMKEINIIMMENAWTDLTTGQIADRIVSGLGVPESLNLLTGEVVTAYVVGRSKH